MKLSELKAQIALGEDSHRQFKRDATKADGLAAEMAAFANSEGGTILLGVDDDDTLPGLGRADVGRLNQLISNAASQHVCSPLTVRTENVAVSRGRISRTVYSSCLRLNRNTHPVKICLYECIL